MKQFFVLLALLYSFSAFAQDHKDKEILVADSTWSKELIMFPLGFAPEIDYEGYEDIRFAKGWNDPKGDSFFTYAFVWNINLEEPPNASMLNEYMALYYDGLMTAVNKDQSVTVPDSEIKFEIDEDSSDALNFKGIMKVYDAFFTKKIITLYAKVESFYCIDQNKYMLLFRISTLDYQSTIWNQLQTIQLTANHCDKN
ncbi:hypothetical protein [Winogradskyella tangerina]|uniref:hypothetical protein n=1 Tax=Winogradskyella tangerina TaxID=2023240 RepID=UPI000DBE278C|nr:hypothetical protein [Winogradskyella tangerina]